MSFHPYQILDECFRVEGSFLNQYKRETLSRFVVRVSSVLLRDQGGALGGAPFMKLLRHAPKNVVADLLKSQIFLGSKLCLQVSLILGQV